MLTIILVDLLLEVGMLLLGLLFLVRVDRLLLLVLLLLMRLGELNVNELLDIATQL